MNSINLRENNVGDFRLDPLSELLINNTATVDSIVKSPREISKEDGTDSMMWEMYVDKGLLDQCLFDLNKINERHLFGLWQREKRNFEDNIVNGTLYPDDGMQSFYGLAECIADERVYKISGGKDFAVAVDAAFSWLVNESIDTTHYVIAMPTRMFNLLEQGALTYRWRSDDFERRNGVTYFRGHRVIYSRYLRYRNGDSVQILILNPKSVGVKLDGPFDNPCCSSRDGDCGTIVKVSHKGGAIVRDWHGIVSIPSCTLSFPKQSTLSSILED